MRQVREVGAHDLPLRALLDEDQGTSAMDRHRLAVLGDGRKHVVRIHDPDNVVVHAAGWLPKAEACRGDALESLGEKLGK